MNFQQLAKTYDDFYAPRYELTVGGKTFTQRDGLVSGLRVDAAIDRVNRFSFTLNDVFDLEERSFTDASKRFEKGADVEVKTGYGEEIQPVLVGTIDSAQPSFPADGGPTMAVDGHDLLHGLMDGTGTGSWTEKTLKSVVEDLVSDAGFEGTEVEGSDVEFPQLAHPETSDHRFLRRLADEYGYECFSRAGVFTFRKPKKGASPALTLEYGRALRSFTPSQGGKSPDVGTVKVRHADKAKEAIVGTAEVPGGGSGTKVYRIPVRSKKEAERKAEAKARDLGEEGGGRGRTVGIPDLQAGTVLELTGLGDEYSTNYYVESAVHQVGSSGYETSFTVTEAEE